MDATTTATFFQGGSHAGAPVRNIKMGVTIWVVKILGKVLRAGFWECSDGPGPRDGRKRILREKRCGAFGGGKHANAPGGKQKQKNGEVSVHVSVVPGPRHGGAEADPEPQR